MVRGGVLYEVGCEEEGVCEMRPKNGTICSKHEEILSLVSRIEDLADKCLEDGQNMERGLDEKRERIKELEKENQSLQDDLDRANREIEDLRDQVKGLELEIKSLEAA